MCGFAGIVASDELRADERARIVPMRDMLVHRGPDEAGLHLDERAGLGHRRLSIIDLATGQQPLANEDGSVHIVYNGEIYNHREVRRELESRGHRYRTTSDTETIVHAYEEWGEEAVHRFRGMFAFAIWDRPRRRLLLARDRLGIKPLYWALVDGRLVFGSEIKAVLASRLIEARPRMDLIPELLATRYLSGSATLFAGISRLEPGHLLVFEGGGVRTQQYWDVPAAADRPAPPRSFALAVEEFRALFDEAVSLRLMSDVPLGMFLSGGIDSSAVAAVMARHLDRPVRTFSVAFKDRAYSELGYARQVAEAVGAERHEIVIDEQDFFGALPRLLWHEDEPIAHPSSVPLYFVSELARRHVKVVLTGEGSDELLAGYGKYPRALWNWRAGAVYDRLLPSSVRGWVAQRLARRLPGRAGRLARRSFLAVPHTAAATFFDNYAAIPLADQRGLLGPSLARQVSDAAYAPSLAYLEAAGPRAALLDRVLYADLKSYLVELLMKQDQMSMAASIESRVPFLDHRLVEFVAGLPPAWKLSGLTTKRLLREAARGLLPPAILRRPKMGFPVPFGAWMRSAWLEPARAVLLDRRTSERGLFQARAVERLLEAHAAGATDGADRIWGLLNLELWFRTFIDGGGIQTLPDPGTRGEVGRSEAAALPQLA